MDQSNLAEAKGGDKHRGHFKKRQFPFALYMFSQHHSRRLTTAMQLHTIHMLRFRKRRLSHGQGTQKRRRAIVDPSQEAGDSGDCPPSKRPRATTSKEADAAIQDAKDAIDAAEQHVQQEANAPEEVHCKFLKAAKHGDTSQVEQTLASGVDVNHQDDQGRTALHFASSYGHLGVARLLLQKGADCYIHCHSGSSPLIAACKHGHAAVAKLLLVDGQADAFHLNNQGRNALMEAAAAGHAECIQHLLDHGSADVNVQHEESGSHALLEAAAAGHAGCVVVLLEAGAKVNRVDKAGVSALLAAACAGHLRCVQLLLQYDPKHIAEYTQKRTPLMAAAANGQCAVVAALLKAGADVDGVDGAGKSALQLAGNVRCKVLLEDQQRGKVNLSPQGRASRQLTWRPQDLQPWMISVA